MVLMAARRIVERKKETCFDGSVGTSCMVALDNTPHNKNDIIRKQLHPPLHDEPTTQQAHQAQMTQKDTQTLE